MEKHRFLIPCGKKPQELKILRVTQSAGEKSSSDVHENMEIPPARMLSSVTVIIAEALC